MEKTFRHIYNRGAHKALVFTDQSDYRRMVKLMYVANNTDKVRLSKLRQNAFELVRTQLLVRIAAYCLMPNHFHIAVEADSDKNVSLFMHRLCTAYSMYFNHKYNHSGTVWEGPYKQKIVRSEIDLSDLISYIHQNPRKIKNVVSKNVDAEKKLKLLAIFCREYEFSSFQDYLGKNRPQKVILSSM